MWFKKEGENTTPHVWDVAQSKWTPLTDKAAADAQAEANAAKEAAGIAQGAAEAKGEVIFSSTAPEAAKQLKQNLWIDTAGGANTPKRWDGSEWVEVTDKAAKDAASAANAAQGAAQAAQDAADEADRKAREALGELDDISDDNKLTPAEKKQLRIIVDDIKQVDVDIRERAAEYNVSVAEYDVAYTALVTDYINDLLADHDITSSIVRTEFNRKFNEFFAKRAQLDTSIAIAAKSVADNAQTTADNKGEVITSDTIPDAAKRKPQNLWIDTRQGKNTPRRWNGSAWEAVTDQAAIDAAADIKTNLATYVQESGAYSTEFGNIAGEITTIQSTVEGVTDSIEVVAAIGDAERLKYEISKERLNKNKAALQGKVADLDSLIAKYKAQRTDAQSKKAQATDAAVIASYDAQIALLNTSITDAETQRSEVASQVTQLEQEITELASLKLTESEIKKQYFVKLDSGNRAAGFGIMENADATIDFAVLADKFYIAPPSGTGKGVRPFAVYTSPTTINGVVVPAGTYLDGNLLATGTITGDKIRAQTEINAPIIKGGQININDKFIVDVDGNLTAVGGYFSGEIAANTIDISTLRKSAWLPSYTVWSLSAWKGLSIDTLLIAPRRPSTWPSESREYEMALPSMGSIDFSSSRIGSNSAGFRFMMAVDASQNVTVKQRIVSLRGRLSIYVGLFSTSDSTPVIDRTSTGEIEYVIPKGLRHITYVISDDNGNAVDLRLTAIGDFIDNVNVKFA